MIGIEKLEYEIDKHVLFKNVSFAINRGEKVGLVGRNGIGKTTLLRIIAGEIKQTDGVINRGKFTIGTVPQNIDQIVGQTIERYLLQITDNYGAIERSLSQTGIPNIDIQRRIESLSGGQKTRVMLAGIFCADFDLILLDEPTNNLDERGIKMLEDYLRQCGSAFLIITHDRRFLRNSINRIIELAGGGEGIYQYALGYEEFVKSREIRLQTMREEHDRYQQEKRRLEKYRANIRDKSLKIQRTTQRKDNEKMNFNKKIDWAAHSTAARMQAIESRVRHMDIPEEFTDNYGIKLNLNNSKRKHNLILVCKDLTAKYPDSNQTFGPISLDLHAGEKIMISGENGTGKTTLLNVIAGKMPVNDGQREIYEENLIYMDQIQSLPLKNQTALNNLLELAPDIQRHEAINILIRLGYKKETVVSVVARNLSGGEKAKILIATITKNKSGLLIMDEPTNNLDIPTIESLESAIARFNGGLIITSHDREFLENIKIDREIILEKALNIPN